MHHYQHLSDVHCYPPLLQKIHRIIVYMRRWQDGDLSKRIKMEGEDELQQISQSFNYMCDRLESYIQTVYISEIKQKNAQLVALQAQINPHFLYNTLEYTHEGYQFRGQGCRSNDLYSRNNVQAFDQKTNTCHSGRRNRAVRMYLALIQYRYENKLQVETNIEMPVAGSIVVKLLIQPIIENYIVHGFRANDDDNRISIMAAKQERHIIIRVKDNGKGIAQEKLIELRKALQSEGEAPSRSSDSLGLKNVHERIRLNYGSEFGIRVISEQDKGCEVIIEIPFTRED